MQTSPDLFTLRTLTDTVLIGPRAAFGRGHRHALQSEEALRQRLTRARIDHGAMQRLRRAFERWRGGEGFVYTTDAALIARVVADTRRGRLAAWVMPNNAVRDLRQPDVERADARITAGVAAAQAADRPSVRATHDQGAARIAAHAVPAQPHPADIRSNHGTPPVRLDVASMTIEARLAEILHRATRSERLTEEMAAQLQAMIAPAQIAQTVAVLAIWAASHAFGIGFFVDLLLLGSGLFFLGWAAVEAARNLKKFVETVIAARTEAELDLAADLLAVVIVTLGIKVLQAAIRRGSVRLTGGSNTSNRTFDKRTSADVPHDRWPNRRVNEDGAGRRPRSSSGVGGSSRKGGDSIKSNDGTGARVLPNQGAVASTAPAAAGNISYMSSKDQFALNAANRSDVNPNGYFDVIAHGSPDKVLIESNGRQVAVGHRELASIIKNSPGYQTGQPIRLLSCSTGAGNACIAQNLANKLGVPVSAPTDTLWAYPSGKMVVGPTADSPIGSFRTFTPGPSR